MLLHALARLRIALTLLIVPPLIVAGSVVAAETSDGGQESTTFATSSSVPTGPASATQDGKIPDDQQWQSDDPTTANESVMGRDGQTLTPELMALGAKIRRTLATYEPKHLNARDNSCWEIMHGLIAFGPRTEIFRDGPGGVTVNAMGWLCWGARCQGEPLIVLENGHPHGMYGVGLEGHDGQYLAMLAQWKVRPESPMHIGSKDFTVADLIQEEKDTCQSGTELTFKLIALAHYLPSDAQWTSRYNEQWNIPRLLKAEIEAPVHGAACGGTHRLFGIANAVNERTKRGEPINGEWARAAKYISDYQRYTLGSLQNPDGSLSTEWFNYPADRPGDIDRKLQTSGHMLEFIVWSLPSDQLRDPRVVKCVDFLSGILLANPDRAWSIGPLGHALHALIVYHQRLYNEAPLPPLPIAQAEPLKTKATAAASAFEPANPASDADGSMTMSRLQKAVERPKPLSPAGSVDRGAKAKPARMPTKDSSVAKNDTAHESRIDQSTANTSTPATPTAKQLADLSDGCTDSIPASATVAQFRLAMRNLASVIMPTAISPELIEPTPPSVESDAPNEAPFDRRATSAVGP